MESLTKIEIQKYRENKNWSPGIFSNRFWSKIENLVKNLNFGHLDDFPTAFVVAKRSK